ncbi:5-aminolevulinate synthase, erythroid-specific, mitochondrial-like [Athene noctua]|uniref:5-aminolevulinate synthase, erythroid-specific, mitochondrial-like n=1 Tax=Athene noctua TaxID=126797 RepID=UPI003EBD9208
MDQYKPLPTPSSAASAPPPSINQYKPVKGAQYQSVQTSMNQYSPVCVPVRTRKAVGSVGGYIAGSATLVDAVRSLGAGFIFTTALPPAVAAGALASFKNFGGARGGVVETHPPTSRQTPSPPPQRPWLARRPCPSHIVPVLVGDAEANTRLSRLLLEDHGLYVQAINHPTVPRGREVLRLAPTPHHSPPMMENLADRLSQCWGALGLPREAPPGPSCSSCHRPLHFTLMSDWERQHFQPGGVPVMA